MARIRPVKHIVKSYEKEDGTKVRSHEKGHRIKTLVRKYDIIPEYLEEQMREKDREWQISEIDRIRKNAKISPHLRSALDEISEALESGNIERATDLTAVKSYITGSLEHQPERNHFREDNDYNEKALGRSVYGILDTMHHNLAFATGTLPSGAMVLTAEGAYNRPQSTRRSPTLAMINKEHDNIYREAAKESKERDARWEKARKDALKNTTGGYCNKCNKYIPNLNELESKELKKEGSFVCSDCINKEMRKSKW
jgi:hypothetical protein